MLAPSSRSEGVILGRAWGPCLPDSWRDQASRGRDAHLHHTVVRSSPCVSLCVWWPVAPPAPSAPKGLHRCTVSWLPASPQTRSLGRAPVHRFPNGPDSCSFTGAQTQAPHPTICSPKSHTGEQGRRHAHQGWKPHPGDVGNSLYSSASDSHPHRRKPAAFLSQG